MALFLSLFLNYPLSSFVIVLLFFVTTNQFGIMTDFYNTNGNKDIAI